MKNARQHNALSLIAAVFCVSCDKTEPAPGLEIPAARVEQTPPLAPSKPERAPVSDEPKFTELRDERAFNDAEIELGLEPLKTCEDYDSYVKDALVAHQLRRGFPHKFGKPVHVPKNPPRVGPPTRFWAVDGDRLYVESDDKLSVLDVNTRKAQVVENPMYRRPALQNVSGGFVFLGKSSWVVGPGNELTRFERGAKSTSWGVYRNTRVMHYEHYQNTTIDLYGPDESGIKFIYSMGMEGRTLGVHVDLGAQMAYFVQETEPHVPGDVAQKAREVRTDEFGEAENALRALKIKLPKEARPHFSWQINPMNTGRRHFSGRLKCDELWVPKDRDTIGEKILLVLPFDLESKKYGTPLAVALEEGAQLAMAGNRLLLARRLHGTVWPDRTMDRPLTELDIFELGKDAPKLLSPEVLMGVPVAILASQSGGAVWTTRGPFVERLMYSVVGGHVAPAPKRLPFELPLGRGQGDLPEFVWKQGLLAKKDLVFTVGQNVVAANHDNDVLTFVVYGADGTQQYSESVADVPSWKPDELVVSDDSFVIPARTQTTDSVVGWFAPAGFEVRAVSNGRMGGQEIRFAQEGFFITLGPKAAAWNLLRDGALIDKINWRNQKATPAGRPTKP